MILRAKPTSLGDQTVFLSSNFLLEKMEAFHLMETFNSKFPMEAFNSTFQHSFYGKSFIVY